MATERHSTLRRRLADVRRRGIVAQVLGGAAHTLLAVLLAAGSAIVLESLFRPDVLWRTVIVVAVTGAALAAALRWLVVPVLRWVGPRTASRDEDLAGRVGSAFPHVRDRLRNILELDRTRADGGWYSGDLIEAAVARAEEEWRDLDFRATVRFDDVRRSGLRLAGAGAIILAGLLFLPSARDAAFRLWHFRTAFDVPPPFSFEVEPGDREIIRGESVPVRIRVHGARLGELVLAARPLDQEDFEERTLLRGDDGAFRDTLSSVKTSLEYAARSGAVESPRYTISVVERPVVRALRVELRYPSYTGRPPLTLAENTGDVSALRGTRVRFTIDANIPLADAALVFSDSTEVPLTVDGARASGDMTLLTTRTYHLRLRDGNGRENTDPIGYRLTALPDAPPTIAVLLPGADIDIAGDTRVAMLVRVGDDFGFSALRIHHRLVRSRYEAPSETWTPLDLPLPAPGVLEADVPYTWDLGGMDLAPEDVVSYYVEVFDNDRVSGPKAARSEIYTLRLPSLEEVFADLDRGNAESMEGMREALEQAEEARRELEKLRQELRRDQQKVSWEQQKKAEQLAESYREALQKVEQASESVRQMVEEMEKTSALSPETVEKYQELQRLMEEMNSPEFAEALRKMQQSMEQLTPEAMRQALKDLSFTEEMFRKSIERTMELLKRLQVEQKVDELVRRAEEMERRQEELAQETEDAAERNPGRSEDLARRQEELRKEQQRMAEDLERLREKMEEFPDEMPMDELARAEQEMEESGLDSLLEESVRELQQQRPSAATTPQRSARRKMGDMKQRMQAMQQALQENQRQQVVNRMRRALEDLLELSRRQEALKNATRDLDPSSAEFRRNAQEQMEVMQDLGRVTESLAQLSNRTFGITPEMGKAIGDALRRMNGAQQSLEQRNGDAAGQEQAGAMASLNEAAGLMQGSMNAMKQGGGQGMGMASFMQRMQQLSGMQQGINQGTQGMGGMTPRQAAAMGRLAAEQGMVRKSLEQLAREAAGTGDLSRMLGDLQKIAEEMREVQSDLAQGAVTPETLEKQERILSRMLDSQRSTRERDYEQRRRAESGTRRERTAPVAAGAGKDARARLQQDLLRALEEGYAPEYQELIRQYFEALQRSGTER